MEQTWQIPHDSLSYLVEPLKELKAHGFDSLLQSLFLDLKVSGACSGQHPEVRHRREGRGPGLQEAPSRRLVGGTDGKVPGCWRCPSGDTLSTLQLTTHILALPGKGTELGASTEGSVPIPTPIPGSQFLGLKTFDSWSPSPGGPSGSRGAPCLPSGLEVL